MHSIYIKTLVLSSLSPSLAPRHVSVHLLLLAVGVIGFLSPTSPSSPPPPRAQMSLGLLLGTPSSQQHFWLGFPSPQLHWRLAQQLRRKRNKASNPDITQPPSPSNVSLFVVFYGNTPLVEAYWQNTLVSSEYKPPTHYQLRFVKKKICKSWIKP